MKAVLPALLLSLLALGACTSDEPRVLVFTHTADYRHGAVHAGMTALQEIGAAEGFVVDSTSSDSAFTDENLRRYDAVVFLNTSGDVLPYARQADFERYIQAGGGFVGIHAAAETEPDWDWYRGLVGGVFDGPVADTGAVTPARLAVLAPTAPETEGLPAAWERTDEWFRTTLLAENARVLVVHEAGGAQVPFAWTHEYDGGRAFFTAGGHTPAAFAEPAFRKLLAGGLRYATSGRGRDYDRARTARLPDESRFSIEPLVEGLDEPVELELLGGGRVLFIQRKGAVRLYDPASGTARTIAQLDVNTTFEDGLLGVAKDPNFAQNNWLYLYYSPAGDRAVNQLSRFELRGDSLVMGSEKKMLAVATQRETCCHTGGSIEFGPDGLLYLSTGDNVNPFESNGFAPIDGRPGRAPFDARGSSSNTNDLRGKVLRIRPEADGTYSIPAGNLFPKGEPQTRPEIYVMGNRNPYRISVDQKKGWLYWGEVGPDAGEPDSLRGPRGYDEVNQARAAGYFGWPLFVGDNQAYHAYDFATSTPGAAFDPAAPVNDSPNNTGKRQLPPAQKAFIWYPYAPSPEFPILGTGGRTAMAGPVFYADAYRSGEGTFPAYYDGKLFIYEWMRGWIMAVTMDDRGDLVRIEPFMPATRFKNPMDMAFDEAGVMYLLEYGTGWFSPNADARLSRIVYNPGNRPPAAQARVDTAYGAAPLTVRVSAAGSRDADGDALVYAWRQEAGGEVLAEGAEARLTFEKPGLYRPTVTVTDTGGKTATASVEVRVGNTPPRVNLTLDGNRSFYWDDTRLGYRAAATDAEDGEVAPAQLYLKFDYLPQGFDQAGITPGHQAAPEEPPFAEGLRLMEGSDCHACHKTDTASIGPSFMAIAARYKGQAEARAALAGKIIQGGGGVWGEQAMAAHPQLTQEEAESMVAYILSLGAEQPREAGLPAKGTYAPRNHLTARSREGTYVLRAAYTDRGAAGTGPLTGQDVVVLRHPRVQAEAFDGAHGAGVLAGGQGRPTMVRNLFDGSYLRFDALDLTGVQQVAFRTETMPLNNRGGVIELRLDAPNGPLVGSVAVAGGAHKAEEVVTPLTPTQGQHDLYVVFRNPDDRSGEPLFLLDWLRFDNR